MDTLPLELLYKIFDCLCYKDIVKISTTNKKFYSIYLEFYKKKKKMFCYYSTIPVHKYFINRWNFITNIKYCNLISSKFIFYPENVECIQFENSDINFDDMDIDIKQNIKKLTIFNSNLKNFFDNDFPKAELNIIDCNRSSKRLRISF